MNNPEKKKETKDILSDLKKLNDLTNEKIADYVGVSETAVSNWMNGQMPRNENIKKLAKLFDVDVSYLYGENPVVTGEELKEVIKKIDVLHDENDRKDKTISRIAADNHELQKKINQQSNNQILIKNTVVMLCGYVIVLYCGQLNQLKTNILGSIFSTVMLVIGMVLVGYGIYRIFPKKKR